MRLMPILGGCNMSTKWNLTAFLNKWIPPNFWWFFLLLVATGVLSQLRRIDGGLRDLPLIVAVVVPIFGGLAYFFTWLPWKLKRMKDAIEEKGHPVPRGEAKSAKDAPNAEK